MDGVNIGHRGHGAQSCLPISVSGSLTRVHDNVAARREAIETQASKRALSRKLALDLTARCAFATAAHR